MKSTSKTAKPILIIIIISLGSKLLGFLREILIASKFGSGMETDTYFISIGITTLMTAILSNAITTTFIPILSEIETKEGKQGKIKHTNNMINIISLFSVVLIVIAWFLSPILIRLMAKGFYGDQYQLGVKLLRIGLPVVVFSNIIGTLTSFLQSEQRHYSSAAIGFPFNIVYISFLLFLSSRFGIRGLMVASVIAVISQLFIQIPEIRKTGYTYKFIFNIKDKYIKKVLYLSIPILIGVAINDLNVIVDKTLASSLVHGSISALNYANKLNGLILGVFVTAITTVIFPLLSKESNNNNISRLKKIMGEGVCQILLITIPATVGLIVLAQPIVEVAFQRGAFAANDTIMTTHALIFYSLGLVSMALRLLLNRVFYSLQDTKTPMINGAISVGFNIALNLILVQVMGHAGLAFATSISTTIATLLLLYGLKNKIGTLGTKFYLVTLVKTGLASGIMGVVAYSIYHGLYGVLGVSKLYNLISLLVAVGVGAIVYVVLCYIFKIEEVRDAVGKVRDIVMRI